MQVFEYKQRWNNDKCRSECKKLIDNGRCDKGFVWNPSYCECDVGEYLDYQNCKCRKRLIEKLVEECNENTDGNKIIYDSTLNDYKHFCGSGTIHIVLLAVFFIISISITSVSIYFHWFLKIRYTETTIY